MYLDIKSPEEISILEESAGIARKALERARISVVPGVSTKEVENIAVSEINKLGAEPAFWKYRGYPGKICVSINDELVHGIPSLSRIIREGDLVKLDIGVKYRGYYGDIAETIPVGNISKEVIQLLKVTYDSFGEMMKNAYPGKRLGDLSYAVQSYVEKNGFSVIRQFVGHGIGRDLHEKPEVPNFGTPGAGIKLESGMVLALEPMVAMGDWKIEIKQDNWTAVMSDGGLCAHFEKMIAVTEKGPVYLANFEPLQIN